MCSLIVIVVQARGLVDRAFVSNLFASESCGSDWNRGAGECFQSALVSAGFKVLPSGVNRRGSDTRGRLLDLREVPRSQIQSAATQYAAP